MEAIGDVQENNLLAVEAGHHFLQKQWVILSVLRILLFVIDAVL